MNGRLLLRLSLLLVTLLGGWGLCQGRSDAAVSGGGAAVAIWSPPLHLSTTSATNATAPMIRVDGDGRLMIVYTNDSGVDRDPLYVASTDNGQTWSAPAPVHASAGVDSVQLAFTFDAANVAQAVWVEGNTLVHAADSQWAVNQTNAITTSTNLLLDPEIVASGGSTLDVVWARVEASSLKNIYHTRSADAGATWSTPMPLATDTQDSNVPVIGTGADGAIHVIWEETILPNFELYYARGTALGDAIMWTTPVSISSGIAKAKRPSLLVDGNTLHVAFARQEGTGEQYAYYIRSNDGGLTWSAPADTTDGRPVGVNTTDPFNLITTLATCGGRTYVYYHGTVSPTDNEQILGANDGNGWQPRDQATNGIFRSINPAIACTGWLHATFEQIDPLSGRHQVYYSTAAPFGLFLPVIR